MSWLRGLTKRLIVESVGGGNKLPTGEKDAIQQLGVFGVGGAKIKILRVGGQMTMYGLVFLLTI